MLIDITLIKRTLDGETEAFGQLVTQYQQQIYRLTYRIIGNVADAQDIAQEVFIKAYQNLETLKDPRCFQAWLIKIARNRCYSWIREKQDNLFSLDQEAVEYNPLQFPPAPDEATIKEELYKHVMRAISELPEKDRKVIELFYLEEKSYKEIQQELGISKSTLGWRLSQARAKLRQKLQTAYHGAAFWLNSQWKKIVEPLRESMLVDVKLSSVSAVKFLMVSLMIHLAVVMTVPRIYYGSGYNQEGEENHEGGLVTTDLLPSVAQTPDQLHLPSTPAGSAGRSEMRVWATQPHIIATSINPVQSSLKLAGVSPQKLDNAYSLGQLNRSESLPAEVVLAQSRLRWNNAPTVLDAPKQTRNTRGRKVAGIQFEMNRSDSIYSSIAENDNLSTTGAFFEDTPSPKIVFVSIREEQLNTQSAQIYVMNIDGSEATPITYFTAKVGGSLMYRPHYPSVSPTGEQITFHALIPGRGWHIFVMDIDGNNIRQLTAGSRETNICPAWSPDGIKIAFTRKEYENMEIYVMRADGSNPVKLTKNKSVNLHPSWSPYGAKIAFSSNMGMDRRIRNIYVMDADGKNIKQLTNNRKVGWLNDYPAWSPDGKYIAYTSGKRDRKGREQGTIFIMDTDGKNKRSLIARASRPAWSADGQKIVFVSNRDGNDEIYMIDVDGKNLKRLTRNRYMDSEPCWLVSARDFWNVLYLQKTGKKQRDLFTRRIPLG